MSDLVADLRSYRVHSTTDSSIRDMVWKMGRAADEIERLRTKAEWADEASELMYNFATGKDDGAAIIAHVRAKLELV